MTLNKRQYGALDSQKRKNELFDMKNVNKMLRCYYGDKMVSSNKLSFP